MKTIRFPGLRGPRVAAGLLVCSLVLGSVTILTIRQSPSLLSSAHTPSVAPAPPSSVKQAPEGLQISSAGVSAAAAAPAATSSSSESATGYGGVSNLPPLEPLIVKNGSLSITVADTEDAISQVGQILKEEQGSIVHQTVRTQNQIYASLTIHVPPGAFEDTMAKLRSLRARGTEVASDSVDTQDVTGEYVDLDAELRNLQTSRDAYQALLTKTTAVSDIITLTRQIAAIQTQMDQIKGRQALLSRQASVATIMLSLTPVGAPPISTQPLPRPIEAAGQAWQMLLAGLQGLAIVLIWLAVLLPLPIALIAGGWLIYRRVARAS